MIYTRPETRQEFLREIDVFGDSFTKDATIESLREVFKQIDREKENANKVQPPLVEIKFRGKGSKDEPKEKRRKKERVPEDRDSIAMVIESVATRDTAEELLRRRVLIDLKDYLKEHKMRISGRKEELIQRILEPRFGPAPANSSEGIKNEAEEETEGGEDLEREEEKRRRDKGKEKVKEEEDENENRKQDDPMQTEEGEGGSTVKEESKQHPSLSEGDIISLEMRHFTEAKPWWGLFRNFIVYFDRYATIG